MANVREYIQINPRVKTNKALGIIFPFNVEGVFPLSYTTKEQVKSNLLNVLLTEPGERVFKPNFGVGLRSYLFENSNDLSLLKDRINNQINRNIAGIELLDVSLLKAPDSHEIKIAISYRVLANQELDTIQINFTQDRDINNSDVSSPNAGGY
jgi:uncharacterized protein